MPELFDVLRLGALRMVAADPAAGTAVALTETASLLNVFNTLVQQRGVTVDPATSKITLQVAGIYQVSLLVNAEFSQSDEMGLQFYVGGAPLDPTFYSFQGRGSNKPVLLAVPGFAQISTVPAEVQIYARNLDNGTLNATIRNANFGLLYVGDLPAP